MNPSLSDTNPISRNAELESSENGSTRISIIIVNYNVKEYLEQALVSIKKSLANFSYEIFVVDNASVDGSVAHIRRRFPEVKLIPLTENVGFGRANNMAIKEARGEYVVLINPDTVVEEATFSELVRFFEDYQNAGAVTCKIIDANGSFSIDCRHSIPTPMIAFWKVIGFSRLFPRSKIFAKYNLTYMDENTVSEVPAISGSFMMIKKEVLDRVGGFDERFFMYCEDIDLCHRINEEGFKIYYVPSTQIVHYKGESTKKDNLDYIKTFHQSLYQFFQKYYGRSHILLFRWIIVLGIFFRGIFIYLNNLLRNHFPLMVDMLILNSIILFSFIARMEFTGEFRWVDFFHNYFVINLLSTIIFLALAFYLEVYPKHRLSVQSIIKANILTFILLASITFFFKQFGYSRIVVLIAAAISPTIMILWRVILKRYYKGERAVLGKDIFSKRTVIVGKGTAVSALYMKITEMRDIGYDLIGVVTIDNNGGQPSNSSMQVLGKLEDLPKLVRFYRIKQIIFSTEELSYEQILKSMTKIETPFVEFKIVPSNLEVMIGKSNIERLDDYPLLEIEYAIGKPFNRFTKRSFDISLSAPVVIMTAPVALPIVFLKRRKLGEFKINGDKGVEITILQLDRKNFKKWINRWLLFWEVVRGKISIVGSPIMDYQKLSQKDRNFSYKPGLTGIVQINRKKIRHPDDAEKYHLFYLKNQSLLLDVEILLKAFFQKLLFVEENGPTNAA